MLDRISPAVKAALIISASVVAGAAVSAVGTPAPSPVMAPPTSPTIATIRIDRVIDGLKQKIEKETILNDRMKQIDDKLKAMLAEAKAEDEAFKLLKPGPERERASMALAEKAARLRYEDRIAQDTRNQLASDMIREMYNNIDAAVEDLARQRGYHIVFSSDETAPVLRGELDNVSRTIALKRFLYVDPTLDITDEVIAFMNNKFAVGAPAATKKP